MWLRRHRWAILITQQAATFVVGFLFLQVVRLLTGKTLHGGVDSLGWIDGIAYLLIVLVFVWGTNRLYRWARGEAATPLGLTPSPVRLRDLVIGFAMGLILNSWLWLASLVSGTATIADTIAAHYSLPIIFWYVGLGLAIALLNGLLEETTSRAFPSRLFDDWPIWRRALIFSSLFALQHLVDEPFRFGRFLYLCGFGAILTLAYIWRGNIWLPFGLHAGYLMGSIIPGGRWHLGSLYDLRGDYAIPLWIVDASMIALAAILVTLAEVFSSRRPRVLQRADVGCTQ